MHSSSLIRNWIRLYSSGAIKLDSREEAAERVLRDRHGHWIIGFNKILGLCSVFNAKLWSILDSLTVLRNRSWDKVSIQTNSVEVI
ncbi:hypothetical protein PVK06_033296 [Gossypium arboreum]|uniref:Uncharacterized protein n=1 Tax=Gossypium arboreum TaxID=29729 RepID=A0ABR0NBW8_GOSAR|nr:hypothetical protein PVK06_033296 [Gossypium arboreum]